MNKIVPTVLTDNKADLMKLIGMVESFTDYFQLDIMDGKFAPTKSVTLEDIAEVKTIGTFEADLMVEEPSNYFQILKDAGALEVIIYIESANNKTDELIAKAKNMGLRVGLAHLPQTSIAAIAPYADEVDSIRFFSGNLGYYGGAFNKSVIPKIRQARARWKDKVFGIDGGVNLENIEEIQNAGINYFAVGSAIMKAKDPIEMYTKFVQAVGA